MRGIQILSVVFERRRFCQFVLTDDHCLMVDTGMSGWFKQHIADQLHEHNISPARLKYVLNSHADVDHYGGNAEARELAPQAIMMAHESDAANMESWSSMVSERFGIYDRFQEGYSPETKSWLRRAAGPGVRLDMTIRGNETIRLGVNREVRLMHLPGHSPGLVAVWDPGSGALIATDAVLGRGMVDIDNKVNGPPPYFDVASYRQSLKTMLAIDFEWLLLSHFPVMDREQGRAFILESLEHVEEVHSYISNTVLKARPQTMKEICAQVSAKFGPYEVMPNELIASVHSHLQDLVKNGTADTDRESDRDQARWIKSLHNRRR